MKKTVLIIENNYMFRRFLESVLPQNYPAFEFILAESADSAKQKIKELPELHCLVTNYFLGSEEPNGIQLAREIRNKFPNLKIILISPSIDDDLRSKASQYGIFHCVSKFDGLYEWIKLMEI
jgi:response regulator of citrate/malate metabolism